MRQLSIIIFSCLFVLNACGLKDKSIVNKTYLMQEEERCLLNFDNFANILNKDIREDITCLKLNLQEYHKLIRTNGNHNYIRKDEVTKFLKRYIDNSTRSSLIATEKDSHLLIENNLSKYIKLFFDLNSFITGDTNTKLKAKRLYLIIDYLYKFNVEAIKLSHLFKSLNKENYNTYLPAITKELSSLINYSIKKLINKRSSKLFNIKSLLYFFPQKYTNFLFFKKILVNSNRGKNESSSVVSIFELLEVIRKSPQLISDLFTISYHIGINAKNNNEIKLLELVKAVRRVKSSLNNTLNPKTKLINLKLFVSLIKVAFPSNEVLKKINIDTAIISLQKYKNKFFKTSPQNIVYKDILQLLNIIQEYANNMYFNAIIFNNNREDLIVDKKISKFRFIYSSKYKIFSNDQVNTYWNNIHDILIKYKYFPPKKQFIRYSHNFNRSIEGINNIFMYRFLLNLAIETYMPNNTKKVVKEKDIVKFLSDGEFLLKDFGLWPEDLDSLVSQVVMGADLFQISSNGDTLSNVDELSEFLVTIVNATKMTNVLEDELVKFCSRIPIETKTINHQYFKREPAFGYSSICYRKNFYRIFNDLNLKKHFPLLTSLFLSRNTSQVNNSFLTNLEIYARSTLKINQKPIVSSDFINLINAFSNIEAAFFNFDKDQNGYITIEEVDNIFKIFNLFLRKTDDSLRNQSESFVKDVLIYMLKYKTMPNAKQAIVFHFFGNKKDLRASRLNVSSILRFIAELKISGKQ